MDYIYIKEFMGYSLFIELLERSASAKLIDSWKHPHDLELWFFYGRIHVVVSNERAFQQHRQDKL